MYGDTDVMRRHVDRLREQAVDVRALADQLVAQTEGTGWSGRAAESMRVRVTERASHLRSAAAQHDTAADALDKHLDEVEQQKEAIAEVERRATSLVADAQTRVARIAQANEAALEDSGARREADPDDVVLASFVPPASGHLDWLSIELPGL